jgi:hypothetical protein
MESQDKIRFEPIWITGMAALAFFLIYKAGGVFVQDGIHQWLRDAPILIIPFFTSLAFLPMFFKMIFGIPALQFINDQLIDNVVGVRIDWENVQNIRISGVSKPFLSIDLKDTGKFYASIRNPFKRILLRGLFALASGDVPVNLAFVAGDNEAAAAMARVYWNRYYGIND